MAKMNFKEDDTVNGRVLLRNKPDRGEARKIRFGFRLNKEQQTYVIERVRELCVEGFE